MVPLGILRTEFRCNRGIGGRCFRGEPEADEIGSDKRSKDQIRLDGGVHAPNAQSKAGPGFGGELSNRWRGM